MLFFFFLLFLLLFSTLSVRLTSRRPVIGRAAAGGQRVKTLSTYTSSWERLVGFPTCRQHMENRHGCISTTYELSLNDRLKICHVLGWEGPVPYICIAVLMFNMLVLQLTVAVFVDSLYWIKTQICKCESLLPSSPWRPDHLRS